MELKREDYAVLARLKENQSLLTRQQIKTIRGQVFAGNGAGAMKGLDKLLARRQAHENVLAVRQKRTS